MSKKINRPKCDPGYRYLSKGEIVKKGDSFIFTKELGLPEGKSWSPCCTTVGEKVGIEPHTVTQTFRRLLKIKKLEAPKVEAKPLPEYRHLQVGEIIQGGDECCHMDGTFEASFHVGSDFRKGLLPVRRKIGKIEKLKPVQKYRPLKAGEKFEAGDEYFCKALKRWKQLWLSWIGHATDEINYLGYEYRRKVPADYKYENPKEVIEDGFIGNKVTVTDKTSRFFGVTGKVIDCSRTHDKKGLLIKYDAPQDKEQYTEGWFWTSEVEKVKKVKKVGYRFLVSGEEILTTDEQVIYFNGEEPVWGPLSDVTIEGVGNGGCYVGPHSAKFKKFRRKV